MDFYTGRIIIQESEYDDLLEKKQRYEECLKSVQEELHYALNTNRDYDIKWYFVK